jgi:hypothetical protein
VAKQSSKTTRLKALPWAGMLQAALAVGERWRSLSEKDRARIARLLRDSRGRAGNLSRRDREELRRLVGKLDLKGAGAEALSVLRRSRRRR